VGVDEAKKLLEEIPNKTRDILGIVVDVNLHQTKHGDVIEIVVEAQPYPVNFKGQYHYRSGSTKQELKGVALDKFLLQRKGKRWDGAPIPNTSVADLKPETFDFFRRRARMSQRIDDEGLADTDQHLLENLQLTEGGYLKRAALLLFHPNPEQFVTGAYIKLGYFQTDDDLRFQDEVHGNLFEQVEKALDLLLTKYLQAQISYAGLARIERLEYPKEALREALLNAVVHKDYSGGTPIQVSVYAHKLIFWNEGQLPEHWTIDHLLTKHPSKPYNPDLANAFFRSGHIESWGRGTLKMLRECELAGLPRPRYFHDMSGFWVEFRQDVYTEDYLRGQGLNKRQVKAVLYVKEKGRIANGEYQQLNEVSRETATRDLKELVDKKILLFSGQKGPAAFYTLD
jgi:ATP-dependent DNA helicase RecG